MCNYVCVILSCLLVLLSLVGVGIYFLVVLPNDVIIANLKSTLFWILKAALLIGFTIMNFMFCEMFNEH